MKNLEQSKQEDAPDGGPVVDIRGAFMGESVSKKEKGKDLMSAVAESTKKDSEKRKAEGGQAEEKNPEPDPLRDRAVVRSAKEDKKIEEDSNEATKLRNLIREQADKARGHFSPDALKSKPKTELAPDTQKTEKKPDSHSVKELSFASKNAVRDFRQGRITAEELSVRSAEIYGQLESLGGTQKEIEERKRVVEAALEMGQIKKIDLEPKTEPTPAVVAEIIDAPPKKTDELEQKITQPNIIDVPLKNETLEDKTAREIIQEVSAEVKAREDAEKWWQECIAKGTAPKQEDYVAKKEQNVWDERFNTARSALLPTQQKELESLLHGGHGVVVGATVRDLFTAGLSLDEIKGIKYKGLFIRKIKTSLSPDNKLVTQEEFDKLVEEKIKAEKGKIKTESEKLYEAERAKNIELKIENIVAIEEAERQQKIAEEERKKVQKEQEEKNKIEVANALSPKERLKKLNEMDKLYTKIKGNYKTLELLKSGKKKVKDKEGVVLSPDQAKDKLKILLQDNFNSIIEIAETLTGENIVRDALVSAEIDLKTGPKPGAERKAFTEQLIKNLEAIFKEQIKKVEEAKGKKVVRKSKQLPVGKEIIFPEFLEEYLAESDTGYQIKSSSAEVADRFIKDVIEGSGGAETESVPKSTLPDWKESPRVEKQKFPTINWSTWLEQSMENLGISSVGDFYEEFFSPTDDNRKRENRTKMFPDRESWERAKKFLEEYIGIKNGG